MATINGPARPEILPVSFPDTHSSTRRAKPVLTSPEDGYPQDPQNLRLRRRVTHHHEGLSHDGPNMCISANGTSATLPGRTTTKGVPMGLLQRLLGREKNDDPQETGADEIVITLDAERRKPQLIRLERALDALANAMRADHTTDDPGWRGRVNEYSRLAGEAMTLRGDLNHEGLLDLVFSIRPVFSAEVPAGFHDLGPLQDEVMAAAEDLRELLPQEKR